MRFGLVAMVMLATTRLVAQEAPEKVATPSDAVGWALADLVTLPAESRPFQRYVWIPPWGFPSWEGTMKFVVNTAANRSSTLAKPVSVANGWLMRWDLRSLADDDFNLKELVEIWDAQAADEPYFHIPETNKRTGLKVAIVAPHIATQHAQLMAQLNASPALVYRADWLTVRMLMTIQGGQYYEFRGIQPSTSKRTDQTEFLTKFGGFEAESQKRNADERVAMRESQVTKLPRRVDGFRGLEGRSSTGQIFITHDMSNEKLNVENDPMYNLLTFEDVAREVIVEANNGLHIFALFDGDGKLARKVNPDTARDTTIPAGYDNTLNGAASCIRCHSSQSGLRDAPNHAAERLSGRLDAFDDISSARGQRETVKRLASLYAGDFTKRIQQGRNDYEDAVFRVTDGMSVAEVSDNTGEIIKGLIYQMVTPQQALWEAGWRVNEKDAAAFIDKRLANYATDTAGIIQEDGTIDDLRNGRSVQRFNYDRIHADFTTRLKESK